MKLLRRPSDISAVVLTTGEATTDRAIASLQRQTLAPIETIVIRDVRPFHRALNAGASRVKTTYFVQVDADMILDGQCVEILRGGMAPDVGIVVGMLRDPMIEQVVGVKLFRTACFAEGKFVDSISPDTDFVEQIERSGWRTVYVGRRWHTIPQSWRSLGEHRPNYEPDYTYRKYLMEGERYRYRGAIGGFKEHLSRLERSSHPSVLFARIGLARGFFRQTRVDGLGRFLGDDEFTQIATFLRNAARGESEEAAIEVAEVRPPEERFSEYFDFARKAFARGDARAVLACLSDLQSSPGRPDNWIYQLAVWQGLLSRPVDDGAEAFAQLRTFVSGSAKPLTRGSISGPSDASLASDFMKYAGALNLRRFAVVGGQSIEYGRSGERGGYDEINHTIATLTDQHGRERVRARFRLGGHVFSSEPDRLNSIMWCSDLLRSGYAFVHFPGPFGAYRVFLPVAIIRSMIHRLGIGASNSRRRTASVSRAMSSMAVPRSTTYAPIANRVLMVTEDLRRGGSERQMLAAARGLLERDISVRMLSLSRLDETIPDYGSSFSDLGVEVEFGDSLGRQSQMCQRLRGVPPSDALPLPPWLQSRIVCVANAIEKYRPSVVHAWLDGPGVASGLAACPMGVPKLIIQQGSLALARRGHSQSAVIAQAYAALARNRRVTLVNNSEAGARDNERWIGLPSGSIGVLRNGFAPESSVRATPDRQREFRARNGISPEAPVVGVVMRFVAEKDPDLWLRTAKAIALLRPTTRFLVCGFGELEASMRATIDDLGLEDRLVIAGPVDDAGLAFSAMDVVLLTSGIEGLPNVLIEAQAVGRPVVTTDAGAAGEALIDGLTGTLVRSRSPDALANAVVALLDDEGRRAAAEAHGPQFVDDNFNLEQMVEATIGYYGKALRSPLPASVSL